MIRKTLTILSLVGLVLSVSAWVLSYWQVYFVSRNNISGFGCGNGLLTFGTYGPVYWPVELPISSPGMPMDIGWNVAGFSSLNTHLLPFLKLYPAGWLIGIPIWAPVFLFAGVYYFVSASLRRDREHRKLGLCLKCGYDLRGSSERCPECGAAIIR